jgi:hypothetical protein
MIPSTLSSVEPAPLTLISHENLFSSHLPQLSKVFCLNESNDDLSIKAGGGEGKDNLWTTTTVENKDEPDVSKDLV